MAHTHYRLTLELSVPDAFAPDRVLRLLRDLPVPGTPIRCIVVPVPVAPVPGGPMSARPAVPVPVGAPPRQAGRVRTLTLVPAPVKSEVSR